MCKAAYEMCSMHVIQIQNPFLTAQSTQIKSVISVPIKDFIHHYPRALFNDIPRVGAHFYDIPGSGRTFTTYPGRDALLRHTRVGAQFNDIPGSILLYIPLNHCFPVILILYSEE